MYKEQYYLAENAYMYPSSNANDGGEDNSENNLRLVTDKIAVKSFVVMRTYPKTYYLTYFLPSYVDSPKGVYVTGGECSINGYYLNLKGTLLEIPDKLTPLTKYSIALRIYKDGVGNLRGDGISVVEPNEGSLESRAVTIGYYEDKEINKIDQSQILKLIYFTTDSEGNIPTDNKEYFQYKDRFMFINSKMIITSTGDSLEEWVNNRISYELRRLDTLQHWNSDELESTLVLGANDVIINLKDRDQQISIVDIEDRTHVAESGKWTESVTQFATINRGLRTYNGTSNLLARSDHQHDERYVVKFVNEPPANPLQKVNTGLQVEGQFIVGETSTTSTHDPIKFRISPDTGSMTAAAGNFSVGSTGSINTKGYLTVGMNPQEASGIAVGDIYTKGKIVAQGTITGTKVFNAVWNDYADAVPKVKDSKVEPGDIICKSVNSNEYELSTYRNRKLVVGVYSDTYGHLLGGDEGKTLEETLETHIPIAVAGNVKVKVVGKVKAGDLIVTSKINGVGKTSKWFTKGKVVGKALEDKKDKGIGKVLIQVSIC